MSILETIKERAIEVKVAAEAADERLAAVFGDLTAIAPARGVRLQRKPRPSAPPRAAGGAELTERERTVKALLDDGTSPAEVARQLGMGLSNVYLTRKKYNRKLGLLTKYERTSAKLDALNGKGTCGKCGLRGEHDCLKANGTERRADG